MYELINNICIHQWKEYLIKKNIEDTNSRTKIPRKDALWKRVLRDIRDFYRILFRNRFYSYNYRNKHYQKECIKIFLKELGLPLPKSSVEYTHLFTFIHQTHRLKRDGTSINRYEEIYENPYCAIDCYNTKTRRIFISNPISARMTYFVAISFKDIFDQLVNSRFKKEYMECLDKLTRLTPL